MDNCELIQFRELIIASIDNTIDAEQFQVLQNYLQNSSEAREYYRDFITIHIALKNRCGVLSPVTELDMPNESFVDNKLWQALAEAEQTAESIEVLEPITKCDTDISRPVIKIEHKVSKLSLYTAILSTAALLLVLAYVFLAPVPKAPIVAHIGRMTEHAVWSVSEQILIPGSELKSGLLDLKSGFAEIQMATGALVLLQAPISFELETPDSIFLENGRLSVNVPEGMQGFVVRTQCATVVDYGTEFGVFANKDGYTEAHVFKGEVDLRVGTNPVYHGNDLRLTKGLAGSVDAAGNIKSLKSNQKRFVRAIEDTSDNFGIPGKRIDLTDIVCGGNGFGTGQRNSGIDPARGKFVADYDIAGIDDRPGRPGYFPVDESSYIDGVFVPDGGGEGKVVVSSQNTVFAECPDTDGTYWCEITSSRMDRGVLKYLAVLNGVEYAAKTRPGLMAHANVGITFDLDEMRRDMPGMSIARFTAVCGMTQENTYSNNSHFWILVDGKIRESFACRGVSSAVRSVNIALNEADRFLTLVTTDGGDGNRQDWCIFGTPALLLETAGNNFD